jgi:hypothetical protein
METKLNEIEINGVKYVPKDFIIQPTKVENYSIVRTYSAGVFAGEVISQIGQEVVMKNARRIWYWDGAASLSQLAMEGTSKPKNCKFPCEVLEIKLLNTIEIIPCTKKGMDSIKEVSIWKQ